MFINPTMGSKCALLLIGVLLFVAAITLPAQGRTRELGETFKAGEPLSLSLSHVLPCQHGSSYVLYLFLQ
jgi:hypothetical protein